MSLLQLRSSRRRGGISTPGPGTVTNASVSAAAAIGRAKLANRVVNTQVGDYAFVLADEVADSIVVANKASAIAFTVPPNSSVAAPIGSVFEVANIGAGLLTLVAGGGVTLDSPNGLTIPTNASAFLVKIAADTWVVELLQAGATVPLANATAQTSNYTAVHGDLVLCDASGGAFTVTLPAVALGRTVTVKKTDSSLNAITVSPASGTVDGSASRKIASQYQSADFISDGVNWFVAMSYNPINRIDLTAAEMNNIAGAPDLNNSQVSNSDFRVPVWRLDQASAEGVGGVVGPLPSYWNTFDLKVIHTIAGAGITGDVQWQGRYNFFAPGGTEGNTLGATVNVTAPAQDNLIETTLISGIAVVQNQLLRVRVDRNAAAGADTLNGDAGVVGLVLGKAS